MITAARARSVCLGLLGLLAVMDVLGLILALTGVGGVWKYAMMTALAALLVVMIGSLVLYLFLRYGRPGSGSSTGSRRCKNVPDSDKDEILRANCEAQRAVWARFAVANGLLPRVHPEWGREE